MKKTEKENKITIDDVGIEIHETLTKFFNQKKGGMQFKFSLSNRSHQAKALGINVGSMASELEKKGYIKIIFSSLNGQRFVFAGDCPLSLEEMDNWVQEQDIIREAQKDFKKQLKD